MSLPGFATPDATVNFAAKFENRYAKDAFHPLRRTGHLVSKIGFGTYRCHQSNEVHFQALQSAIQKGCNIIDTSANYTDGFSERLIGDVLNQEIVWGNLNREEIVLVSKAGYIQGENLKIAQKNEDEKDPFPEVVKYGPNVWHCIHPYFIRDQITRTLTRMHLDTLDFYLLHNPEYFLMDAQQRNDGDLRAVRDEFYRRVHQSFLEMERLVEQGLIRWYGISSNTFVVNKDRPDFVSLANVWEIYQDVCTERAEQGHFAVIQFPFNGIENDAYTIRNNDFDGERFTVLGLAQKLNLGVMVNRPLNVNWKHKVFRLARYGGKEGVDHAKQFQEDLEKLLEIENQVIQLIDNEGLDEQINQKVSLRNIFQNVDTLRKIDVHVPPDRVFFSFDEMISQYFLPLFKIGETTLLRKIPKEKTRRTKNVLEGYFNQFNITAKTLRNQLDIRNYRDTEPLRRRFDRANQMWADKLTFSQKALSVAAATPGVDVVLNGMRTPSYVDDSMGIMQIEGIKIENLFTG